MTAPSPQCQAGTTELLAELRRHETDYPELIHGPLCGQAADRIEVLEAALRNMMGAYDTPIARRRMPPDDFMREALESGRTALQNGDAGR